MSTINYHIQLFSYIKYISHNSHPCWAWVKYTSISKEVTIYNHITNNHNDLINHQPN